MVHIQIHTTIAGGLPVQAEVTAIHYPHWRDIDTRTEIEFRLLDRRGRPAPWAEGRASALDRKRIEEELQQQLAERAADDHGARCDAAYQAWRYAA